MTEKPVYLFLHGGPGLNSNPEKHLIRDRFHNAGLDIFFWNEPSSQRSPKPVSYNFTNWLASAGNCLQDAARGGKKVHLLAHSYGAQAAIGLSQKYPCMIERIIFITPAFIIHDVDMKVFAFCKTDYSDSDPEKAGLLEEIMRKAGEGFDDAKASGWLLALGNSCLATHYFNNHEAMQKYFGYLMGEYQIDVESLMEVRKSAYRLPVSERSDIPAVLFFCADDEIIDMDLQKKSCESYFSNIIKTVVFKRSKHFPHLDEPDRFLAELLE